MSIMFFPGLEINACDTDKVLGTEFLFLSSRTSIA